MSERLYALKEAKKLLGFTTRTIQRWDKDGKIKVVRTLGGRRRVPESEIKRILGLKEERSIIGYARVSSSTQRDDLERQRENIMAYVREKGYGEIEVLTDIVSGLNEKRKNFLKLLEMFSEKKVYKVIVAYEDRLTRFGFETLSRLFSSFGTTIEVINRKEKTHKYNEVVEGVKKLVSG